MKPDNTFSALLIVECNMYLEKDYKMLIYEARGEIKISKHAGHLANDAKNP